MMQVDGAGPGPGSIASNRAKGRQPLQLRDLYCERGLIQAADGSALWKQDSSSVLAAVYGPKQASLRKEDSERAVIEVVYKTASGLSTAKEHESEYIIRRTIEGVVLTALHPRTAVHIILQIAHDDGSILACALNATCAALVDAGVPMSKLLAAVACAVTAEGAVLVDPDLEEQKAAAAVVCLAFTHRQLLGGEATQDVQVDQGVLTSVVSGSLSIAQYFGMMQICRDACSRVVLLSRISVAKAFQPVEQA